MKKWYAIMVIIVAIMSFIFFQMSKNRCRNINEILSDIKVGMNYTMVKTVIAKTDAYQLAISEPKDPRPRILLFYSGFFVYRSWTYSFDGDKLIEIR